MSNVNENAASGSQRSVSNPTTAALTSQQLNSEYPSAGIGFEVICSDLSEGPLIYKKTSSAWYSIPLGTV